MCEAGGDVPWLGARLDYVRRIPTTEVSGISAVRGQRVVGFLLAVRASGSPNPSVYIYVSPVYRELGIASGLLERCRATHPQTRSRFWALDGSRAAQGFAIAVRLRISQRLSLYAWRPDCGGRVSYEDRPRITIHSVADLPSSINWLEPIRTAYVEPIAELIRASHWLDTRICFAALDRHSNGVIAAIVNRSVHFEGPESFEVYAGAVSMGHRGRSLYTRLISRSVDILGGSPERVNNRSLIGFVDVQNIAAERSFRQSGFRLEDRFTVYED